jgi:hypothetical protein
MATPLCVGLVMAYVSVPVVQMWIVAAMAIVLTGYANVAMNSRVGSVALRLTVQVLLLL